MNVTPEEFLADLKTGDSLKIKVLNLGENLGMDFAYFCHYRMLREFFPNVTVDVFRSNVDETNCIGLETYNGRVNLPIDDLQMCVVKQRYNNHGGTDWVNLIGQGRPLEVFTEDFLSDNGYDYICRIGMASSPQLEAFWPNAKWIDTSIMAKTLEDYNAEVNSLKSYPILDIGDGKVGWDRTLVEYMCFEEPDYPYTFTPEFEAENQDLATKYKDYLRVGLRWPDYVRWYYGIDKQFNVLFEIATKLRSLGKPVNIVFSLKDGEVGKNFNRGQTADLLAKLKDMCDDILFTYSWTESPYVGRLTEEQELQQLRNHGITNVRRLTIWEDVLLAKNCKTYLAEPGGFAEFITILRKNANSNFLFPTSFGHAATYITLDQDRKPIHFKVNPMVIDQCYKCEAVLNPIDELPRRTLHWNIKYKDSAAQIGDNNNGDDWMHFENAQDGIYTEWYNQTKDNLIDAVIQSYIGEE